jgi:glycyl-tRNA synthetase
MAQENREGDLMEKIVSLCKRRGFVYQGSEIYGGLAGTWDYGPLGVALKKNIENLWWKRFVLDREDMYGIDAAILMHPKVWESSGHVAGFSDPLVECEKCKKRFRADHLENKDKCPECGGTLGSPRQFNMMFKTHAGATEDESSVVYLRPETAGGMFVNFKNIIDTFHPKLPFGMAQIGKAFRNEIAPRDFIFRVRELEQMEIEYFVKPAEWERYFGAFEKEQLEFLINDLGLAKSKIHSIQVPAEDRAHYSKHSVDTEFDFPFGQKELLGLAYRTDFDLNAHAAGSKVDLSYFDEETKERYVPHVIEPTFGVGRLLLAVIADAYAEDEQNGEPRAFLKFSPKIAPVKAAVFPLLKNKPELVEKARSVFAMLKKDIPQILWDDNGNIGKRYRRQDEVGTPFCITVDFDTLDNDTVTVRHRDTGQQERVEIEELPEFLKSRIESGVADR